MPEDDYETKWPNYCRTCNGWGAHTWTEYHDPGLPGEPMAEPCEDCTSSQTEGPQKCPRCGELALSPDGEGPCVKCDWDYDDGLPEADDWPDEPFEDPTDETED